MNWVKENREILESNHYVLKADANSNYWFGLSKNKVEEYNLRLSSNFNIILFGNEFNETDFYVIPFYAIEDLLIDANLYSNNGRWVGDIKNHILRIRNSKTERNISMYFSNPLMENEHSLAIENNNDDYAIENAKREIQIRIGQSVFRKRVLENFNCKCCLTGVMEKKLLVASHIIPWSAKIETRLSPHNGLCLSILYDSLFDKGFFTINNEYDVVVTSKVESFCEEIQKWLKAISNKKIMVPINYEISKSALEYHQNNIFEKFLNE